MTKDKRFWGSVGKKILRLRCAPLRMTRLGVRSDRDDGKVGKVSRLRVAALEMTMGKVGKASTQSMRSKKINRVEGMKMPRFFSK